MTLVVGILVGMVMNVIGAGHNGGYYELLVVIMVGISIPVDILMGMIRYSWRWLWAYCYWSAL